MVSYVWDPDVNVALLALKHLPAPSFPTPNLVKALATVPQSTNATKVESRGANLVPSKDLVPGAMETEVCKAMWGGTHDDHT